MTDTERIATALLGWVYRGKVREGECFQKARPVGKLGVETAYVNRKTGKAKSNGWGESWPDFTTLDGCRLFEDALFRLNRKLFLHGHHTEGGYVDALCGALDSGELEYVLTQATPEQRVKACLSVQGFYMSDCLDQVAKEK